MMTASNYNPSSSSKKTLPHPEKVELSRVSDSKDIGIVRDANPPLCRSSRIKAMCLDGVSPQKACPEHSGEPTLRRSSRLIAKMAVDTSNAFQGFRGRNTSITLSCEPNIYLQTDTSHSQGPQSYNTHCTTSTPLQNDNKKRSFDTFRSSNLGEEESDIPLKSRGKSSKEARLSLSPPKSVKQNVQLLTAQVPVNSASELSYTGNWKSG